jgi:hypothetical protein
MDIPDMQAVERYRHYDRGCDTLTAEMVLDEDELKRFLDITQGRTKVSPKLRINMLVRKLIYRGYGNREISHLLNIFRQTVNKIRNGCIDNCPPTLPAGSKTYMAHNWFYRIHRYYLLPMADHDARMV